MSASAFSTTSAATPKPVAPPKRSSSAPPSTRAVKLRRTSAPLSIGTSSSAGRPFATTIPDTARLARLYEPFAETTETR